MDKRVYAAVESRADGRCENCSHLFGITLDTKAELDHFEGRARSESVETCWLLCGNCHRAKTRNDPSSSWWLASFGLHCLKYGYTDSLKRALAQLQFKVTREALGERLG